MIFSVYNQIKVLPVRLEHYNFIQAMQRTALSYSTPKHNYHAPLSQRFPQDIECILQSGFIDRGNLYISNIDAAENPYTLNRYSIKAVMSCAKGYILNHSKNVVPYYMYIPAVDDQSCDISVHFDQGVEFIQRNLKSTNVLVHCLAGVSRSVSMVIAYLIKIHKLTNHQAFNLVKSRRKIINPNEGFRQQLKRYHLEVSSSRSQQSLKSTRQTKTPVKYAPDMLSTYKPLLLKQERTASTDYKSLRENINDKCGYLNFEAKKDLMLENRKNQSKLQESYRFKDRYSPSKYQRYQHKYQESNANKLDSGGYFNNMSQDLDQRIQKIKQKYEMHRQKLSQTYFRKHLQNTYQKNKFNKSQIEFINHRADRLKTQSYHQFIKKSNLSNDRENYRDLNTKTEQTYENFNDRAQYSIGRTLRSGLPSKTLKNEERNLANTYILSNEHYRIPGKDPKKQNLLYYKYNDFKSRNNYEKRN